MNQEEKGVDEEEEDDEKKGRGNKRKGFWYNGENDVSLCVWDIEF